jgi:hypothetical protein
MKAEICLTPMNNFDSHMYVCITNKEFWVDTIFHKVMLIYMKLETFLAMVVERLWTFYLSQWKTQFSTLTYQPVMLLL